MLGFIRGVIYGCVVSGLGLAAVSVALGPVNAPNAGTEAPDVTTAPETAAAPETDRAGDADLVTDEAAPQVTAPEADTLGSAADAGQDTAPLPEADTNVAGTAGDVATGVETDAPDVPGGDAPVLPAPQAALPGVSAPTEELSISTEPAQPQAPSVDAEPVLPTQPEQEDTPAETQEAAVVEEVTPAATPEPEAAPEEAPAEPEETEVAALPPAEPEPAPAPEVEDETADVAPEPEAEPESAAQEDTGRVTIGKPATTLTDRAAPAPEAADPSLPPLQAYAADFENAEARPLMSIILIDDGTDLGGAAVGPAALSTFPYPLTFAVKATLADAGERMASYRALGFEVLAMVDLPSGATAQDAEANVSAALQAVPEAVGVLEGPETGVQDNRDAAEQVTAAVQASGHGLVLQAKGLNTVQKLARRDGVPAAIVFRDFDSAGQSPTVMRRFLDQAAFRAGQEEAGVIMMGRVRPDTISALLLWGLQDRASRVALAPVSALLLALPETP